MSTKEALTGLLKSSKFLKTASATCFVLGGGCAGYAIALMRLEKKYEALAELEIAQAKEFYSALNKTDYPTPADAVEALVSEEEQVVIIKAAEAMLAYRGEDGFVAPAETVVEEEGVQHVVTNVFEDNATAEVDWEEMVLNRDPGTPYIISQEEFMENEQGYPQVVLTYFEGDDTLIDQKDDLVEDVYKVIGNEALSSFGVASNDNDLLYMRNEEMEIDFEIHRSRGEYAKEVLGFSHSDKPVLRRFRQSDDG